MIGSRDILAGVGAVFVILVIGGIAAVAMMLFACSMSDAPIGGFVDCFSHF